MVDVKKIDFVLRNTGDMCLKRRAKILLTELNPQKKDKILDVGCGDGFYPFLIGEMGDFNVVGIDNQAKSIKAAKRLIRKKGITFIYSDLMNMPFKKDSFNKIICSEVLEHLPNDLSGLKSIASVLKKNGYIYITVPHLNYPFLWDPINWILQHIYGTHIKSGFWAGVWNMHDRLYTSSELKRLVTKAGLKIKRIEYVTHYGLPFNHYLTNIGFRLRTSKIVSREVKQSMSKFHPDSKKTWFSYVLDFINSFDKMNDKKFSTKDSTVGIFLKAQKV